MKGSIVQIVVILAAKFGLVVLLFIIVSIYTIMTTIYSKDYVRWLLSLLLVSSRTNNLTNIELWDLIRS